MNKLKGVGVSSGIAIAPIYYHKPIDLSITEKEHCSPEEEMKRFQNAKLQALKELDDLFLRTKQKDKSSAEVFKAHQLMVNDIDYNRDIENLIHQGKNVEFAVQATGKKYYELIFSIEDEMMKSRANDIADVTNRLIKILKNVNTTMIDLKEKVILISEELLPSEIIGLNPEFIVGVVTKYGSKNSHVAILARTLNIPMIIGIKNHFHFLLSSQSLAINGTTGEVFINPSIDEIKFLEAELQKAESSLIDLNQYIPQEAITSSGQKVVIGANISSIQDLDQVIENNADMIGLFRTEFVFLNRDDFPSEEDQFEIYKEVVSKFSPKTVVFRTIDIGSDKTLPYFQLEKEENPALGYRAIRICLDDTELFKTQLRALFRASIYGNLHILLPMITGLNQIKQTKALIKEVKDELTEKQISYKNIPLGIMIETPAAAILSDEFAKEVDFFSIGTNDLTQYTLAADRMNAQLDQIYDSAHEAVKRLISLTIKNAHKEGRMVGVCGESAADVNLLDFYLNEKIDILSVAPNKILQLKKQIISR